MLLLMLLLMLAEATPVIGFPDDDQDTWQVGLFCCAVLLLTLLYILYRSLPYFLGFEGLSV
jgi:hypothetical protein